MGNYFEINIQDKNSKLRKQAPYWQAREAKRIARLKKEAAKQKARRKKESLKLKGKKAKKKRRPHRMFLVSKSEKPVAIKKQVRDQAMEVVMVWIEEETEPSPVYGFRYPKEMLRD